MRHRRSVRIAGVACGLVLLAAACGDDDDTTTPSDEATTTEAPATSDNSGDGELKIGYLLPESGDLGFLGPPMVGGVKMAIEEINAAGGVLGKDIVLVGQDDGTDPEVAGAGADSLLADGVDFIVGPAGSSIALSVLDKITGAGIPMCSPSNTGVQFTTVDDNGGYYFRTAPPDNLQAQVLADLIVEDGHQNVAVIAQSTEYGEGFANYLVEELNALGATASDPILYDAEAGSYQAEAEQIAAAKPDAVAVISYAEGSQVITSAIAEGIGPQDGVQWYGGDGIQGSSFWKAVDAEDPTVVEGIRGTAPSAAPADGEATFRERFEAFAPGVDTIYSGHAYDCVVLAALAAIAAESDAPADIQAGINDVSGGGEKCALFADCLELLSAPDTDIDYDGAAGPLDFVEAGEPGAGAYDTWTFDAAGAVAVIEESIPVAGDG